MSDLEILHIIEKIRSVLKKWVKIFEKRFIHVIMHQDQQSQTQQQQQQQQQHHIGEAEVASAAMTRNK